MNETALPTASHYHVGYGLAGYGPAGPDGIASFEDLSSAITVELALEAEDDLRQIIGDHKDDQTEADRFDRYGPWSMVLA